MKYREKFNKLFVRVLRKFGVISKINLLVPLTLGARKIKLPILEGMGTEHLSPTEPWLTPILNKLFKIRKGAFIDIGVHTGETLLKFLEIDDDRLYYGFEPSPLCVAYVERLVRVNNLVNVHVIPVALSDRFGVKKLFSRGQVADGTASLVKGYRTAQHYQYEQIVAVACGDLAFEQVSIDTVAVVKIDVEGAESNVISGLYKTLDNNRPFVICEILPIQTVSSDISQLRRERANKIQNILDKLNYGMFQIIEDGRLTKLEHIETHERFDLCQYLFCPLEYMEEVIQ